MPPSASSMALPVVAERPDSQRDWVEWYGDLETSERRGLRDQLLSASYDEVKTDSELRNYFLFHSEDLADDLPPGTERIAELHTIVQLLRGATEPELQEKRRKAVAFLLAEYQAYLRDNPWDC